MNNFLFGQNVPNFLPWYGICKCMMASTININKGINKPIHGYHNSNTCQISTFGGYINYTIPNHYGWYCGDFFLAIQVFAWYIDLSDIENKHHDLPFGSINNATYLCFIYTITIIGFKVYPKCCVVVVIWNLYNTQ